MKLLIYAPDIFVGDAVGNHCFGVARSARRCGWDVEMFSQRFDPSSPDVRHVDHLFSNATQDDLLFVSYSIADDCLDRLVELPCAKLAYYHGVTDPNLLRAFEPRTADLCSAGLDQLTRLSAFNVLAANSHKTAAELKERAGIADVSLVPPVFADMPAFRQQPVAPPRPERHTRNLLSVGRVVPHKRIEDLLQILAHIRDTGREVTLTVVGTMPNYDYSKHLFNLGRKLNVLDYVDFAGVLDDSDLFYCYSRADALISMSLHEGFGVPALEAMHFGLPVFARGGTAIDEVLGDVGRTFRDETAENIGRDIGESLFDEIWCNRQRTAGFTRAAQILEQSSDQAWASLFSKASTRSIRS
ncbi:glycosyltransferase [Burkholderia ubonensis]|uniref:glycosyltransferase n=1 Tax=Burkholderia ubonensis TaxID=101571 RepID=UPI000759720D|nr:glycosyltransferase [Burkholderia ubonensis]KVS42241.1 hypothetical protein WK37_19275 [Burkholderia ubonensis]KVS48107.1 hypothetical protein WK38_20280 [Burkholderia ubonensis]KVS80962.1 hypothetical protein WK42_12775 [Burkholderia ubonensis]KVS85498.1 hypothetical protein WK44_21800 [Burkholderia ubonensis]KVS85787.1 hypothetical protein WK45_33245 [Burkholderia ubonensis]